MSTQTEITRLQTARNTIRTKLVDLGLATAASKLDALATAVDGIDNQGAVSASVKEGESYTIPKGYHNGAGTVKGVSGGGNYSLQAKSITPTKKQQSVTPDAGYYGLSGVTVNPIPDNYNDTSSVTAEADEVLANRVFVNADGETVTGTMPNHAHGGGTLDTTTTSYKIAKGFYSGLGSVNISLETKSTTPTKGAQTIVPTKGKVLSSVTVYAIPDAYQDVTGVTAAAGDVLAGKVIVDAEGAAVTGTMADNGSVSATMDGLVTTSVSVPAGYTSGGTISLTNAIETALAAI